MRSMFVVNLMKCCLLSFLIVPACLARSLECIDQQVETKVNEARGDNYSVTVTRVKKVSTPERKQTYWIRYKYEFKDRSTVYIQNVGIAPSIGDMSYFTYELELEFADATRGNTLAKVPLKETEIAMGSTSFDIPEESQIPKSHIEVNWSRPIAFRETIASALSKWFYFLSEEKGTIKYLKTTYTDLVGLPKGYSGQVALVISYPFNPTNGGFSFWIQVVVREKLSLDQWRWSSLNKPTEDAARRFVSTLIEDLEKMEAR